MRRIVILLAALFVTSPVLADGVYETEAMRQIARKAAVIESLEVSPTLGGINPDAFAYVIKGLVQTGTNRCDAGGRKIEIRTKIAGQDLLVYATVTKAPQEDTRVCTMEYDPVMASFEFTVRGYRSKVDQMVIVNVDRERSYEGVQP
ncbi:MAG: hypothetical protein RIQ81_1114 [Pseudomonadota bacterium]